MNKLEKKTQALQQVDKVAALRDVQRVEPGALMHIIDEALDTPAEENHWYAYEKIKNTAYTVVGWGAAKDELRTSMHYEAMIQFIDWLLPETLETQVLRELDEPLYSEDHPVDVPRVRRIYGKFELLGDVIESLAAEQAEQIDGQSEKGKE